MEHVDLLASVIGWAETALERQPPHGWTPAHAITTAMWPTPQGPSPVVLVSLTIPSPVVGDMLVTTDLLPLTRPVTADKIDRSIATGLAKLSEMHARALQP
jgi:hypothetical protein